MWPFSNIIRYHYSIILKKKCSFSYDQGPCLTDTPILFLTLTPPLTFPYHEPNPLSLSPPHSSPHSWVSLYPILFFLSTHDLSRLLYIRNTKLGRGALLPQLHLHYPLLSWNLRKQKRASDVCCAWVGTIVFGKFSSQPPGPLLIRQEFFPNNWTKPGIQREKAQDIPKGFLSSSKRQHVGTQQKVHSLAKKSMKGMENLPSRKGSAG